MATGDISSVTINADAYTATVRILGLSSGGSYAFGLNGVNNDPLLGAPKVLFTVTSMAFDSAGNATTKLRYVYGTIFKYQPYPNQNSPTETVVGSDVDVMIALSDPIYAKENTGAGNSGTAVTCTILAGFYTQGGTPNNAVTNLTVTNNSTLGYFKVTANWTSVPLQHIRSNTIRLSAVAFAFHPEHMRPVNFVKFSATDGTNTVTADSYVPRIDKSLGDKVPFCEYYVDLDVSTLTQGAEITTNFIAYPFIGDSSSPRDSSTGPAQPTPRCGPQTHLLDRTGAYGTTIALVDPTGSDAGANTVYDSGVYDPATAYKFLTIGKAAAAIAAYNNTNRGRNDVGAGIIELSEGSYNWMGSTNTYGTTPKCFITVQAKTGAAKASTIISGASGNSNISGRIKLKGVTITSTANSTFTSMPCMYFEDCDWNTSGGGVVNNPTGVSWVVRGKVINFAQGFRPNSTNNCPFALVRGVDLGAFTRSILCYTVVGNHKYGKVVPNSMIFMTEYAGMGAPNPSTEGNWIIFNNIITGLGSVGSVMVDTGGSFANPYGGAFIQNVMEIAYTDSNGLGSFGSGDTVTTNTPIRGYMLWHNTLVGNRVFIGYNDSSTPSIFKDRYYWSLIGNYMDRAATKGSEHPTADPLRFGNMTQLHGIGYMGNHFEMNMISTNSFFFRFVGLASFQPAGVQGTAANAQFVDRKSTTEVSGSLVAGPGDGDYRVAITSPLVNKLLYSPLPFDIAGNPRTQRDAIGAYSQNKTSLGKQL